MSEEKLREEFEKINKQAYLYFDGEKYISETIQDQFEQFKKGYSLAQETIKAKDAEIEDRNKVIRSIVLLLDTDEKCPDIDAYSDLHCSLFELVESVIKSKHTEIKSLNRREDKLTLMLGEKITEIKTKDAEIASIFSLLVERDKAIAEARCIIQTSLGFCGVNMAIENEKRANEWLEKNK